MERLNTVGQPGTVHRLRDEQVAHRTTWSGVPDDMATIAAVHSITMVPANGSTVTTMNPLDPVMDSWRDHPDADTGKLYPAGRPM